MRRPPSRVAPALLGLTSLVAVGALVPVAAATAQDTPPGDLIISEYVEGSSNNKAIEIYNPTTAAVDVSAYSVVTFFNGSASPGLTISLSSTSDATLEPGETYVLAQASAADEILAVADETSRAGWFNGDDAIELRRDGAVVDSIGQVGLDPGSQWGTGLVSTADKTLRRLPTVCSGDTDSGNVFDPAAQWSGFDTDTFDGLGSHASECEGIPGPGGGTDPEEPDPEEPDTGVCGDPATAIGAVQGAGASSPSVGQMVTIEGVVVADLQAGLNTFYVQDAGDDDAATSDALSVFGGAAVDEGDLIRLTGTVTEFRTLTQLTDTTVDVCESGVELPAPVALTLPLTEAELEPFENMRVTFPQDLAILEYFNFGRFGEIVLGTDRQHQPTAVYEPGSSAALGLLEANLSSRITLDDGNGVQNPDPARHPNGEEFTLDNTFRGGDLVSNATGVLDFRFGLWRIQPTEGADFTVTNPRPAVPEVGGSTTVASFNVLNYFTSIGTTDSRGADTLEEFERQEAKIVAAIAEMDADVVGLIEIENNDGVALDTLVAALNEEVGPGTYAAIDTGTIGTDAITVAYVYQPARVEPVGDYALLDESVDPRWLDDYNRPALAQTFRDLGNGGTVTVVNNHLKSKGSACTAVGDPQDPDGQGNCNGVRTAAAAALGDWLAGDPTGTDPVGSLIIGDLNSYDKEDPIVALREAGFTDLLWEFQGEFAYSYVFDGQLGYLDYAMASQDLLDNVTGADVWRINADEPSLIDYDTTFKDDAQDALFAPDPYRSSDHDPVLVGLELDTVAPELEVLVDPEVIWPPNNKWRPVTTVVEASDNSGEVTVTLVGAEAEGARADIRTVSDAEFEVRAVRGATYTLTYEATDAAGNTTTASVTVTVPLNQGKGHGSS